MSNLNEKPHLIYGAKVFKDGDQYCCLYGENLQEGIAEYGNTPDQACENFDRLWRYGESKSPVVNIIAGGKIVVTKPYTTDKVTEESLREALLQAGKGAADTSSEKEPIAALNKELLKEKELTCIRIAFNDSKILQLMYEAIDANCTSPQIHLIENAMVEKLEKAGIDIFTTKNKATKEDMVSVSEVRRYMDEIFILVGQSINSLVMMPLSNMRNIKANLSTNIKETVLKKPNGRGGIRFIPKW